MGRHLSAFDGRGRSTPELISVSSNELLGRWSSQLNHTGHCCAGMALMWMSPHPWPSRSIKLCVYMKPVLWLVVGRAARGDRFGDETIHLFTALATEAKQNLDGLAGVSDGLGVKSLISRA